jgi:cobalt/nickel transport system permease protein
MADALVSPAVGGTMWAVSAGLLGYCAKKVKKEADDKKVPLMGVVGAFIFAAQMINFTIPGTGSSGHLGGGMILAILLGPFASFITISSVLFIQALFFADGGLLALGCNIFNLGFFPAFIAYPLIYRPIAASSASKGKIITASILSAILALQLGSFFVVLQTTFSGIAELPFKTFLLLMQPIHLAIGIVEGVATAAIIMYVWKARPEMLTAVSQKESLGATSVRKVVISFLVIAAITGGVLSWFASSHPDGLEWALFKTSGQEELESPEKGAHTVLSDVQEKTAVLPDYSFKESGAREDTNEPQKKWAGINAGTSLSGLVGGILTLLLVVIIGFVLKIRTRIE